MKLPRFFSRKPTQPKAPDSLDDLLPPAREQHYIFAHMVLPGMGFSRPGEMLLTLGSDEAADSLKVLWKMAGEDLPSHERVVPEGLSCFMRKCGDYAIAIITLPKAINTTEAHFTACAFGPVSQVPEGQLHNLPMRYFTLEVGFTLSGEARTTLCEWTADPTHLNMGDGPDPEPEAFYNTICALLSSDVSVSSHQVLAATTLDGTGFGDGANITQGEAACNACHATFPITDFSPDDRQRLRDQHLYEVCKTEFDMLQRVQNFYKRYPELEHSLKSDLDKLMDSDDPEIQDKVYSGIPFDEIEIPEDEVPLPLSLSAEDQAVVEYLRTTLFSLQPRLERVSEEMARLRPAMEQGTLVCPTCGQRHLRWNAVLDED